MDTELVVVWNGSIGRNYRPFMDTPIDVRDPLEPLPPKDPHACQWQHERQRVLTLMSDGQARRIKAIGRELAIPQHVLHGFMQHWRRKQIMLSVPGRYGYVRLNRAKV